MKTKSLSYFLVLSLSSIGICIGTVYGDDSTIPLQPTIPSPVVKDTHRSHSGGSPMASVMKTHQVLATPLYEQDPEQTDASSRAMLSDEAAEAAEQTKRVKRVPRSFSGGSGMLSTQKIVRE